jgi:hypothetical protein
MFLYLFDKIKNILTEQVFLLQTKHESIVRFKTPMELQMKCCQSKKKTGLEQFEATRYVFKMNVVIKGSVSCNKFRLLSAITAKAIKKR